MPLQSLPVSGRPHWTDPVSREETLKRREKFRLAPSDLSDSQLEGISNLDRIRSLKE
jgi:hypothetical protein